MDRRTDGQTDGSGRTERRGSQNSYLGTAISIFFLRIEKMLTIGISNNANVQNLFLVQYEKKDFFLSGKYQISYNFVQNK